MMRETSRDDTPPKKRGFSEISNESSSERSSENTTTTYVSVTEVPIHLGKVTIYLTRTGQKVSGYVIPQELAACSPTLSMSKRYAQSLTKRTNLIVDLGWVKITGIRRKLLCISDLYDISTKSDAERHIFNILLDEYTRLLSVIKYTRVYHQEISYREFQPKKVIRIRRSVKPSPVVTRVLNEHLEKVAEPPKKLPILEEPSADEEKLSLLPPHTIEAPPQIVIPMLIDTSEIEYRNLEQRIRQEVRAEYDAKLASVRFQYQKVCISYGQLAKDVQGIWPLIKSFDQ